eukprot:10714492-Alexandrium_andersonii.AAC.1
MVHRVSRIAAAEQMAHFWAAGRSAGRTDGTSGSLERSCPISLSPAVPVRVARIVAVAHAVRARAAARNAGRTHGTSVGRGTTTYNSKCNYSGASGLRKRFRAVSG